MRSPCLQSKTGDKSIWYKEYGKQIEVRKLNNEKTNYWFKAKKYGWGWGLPTAWQGWVVFVAFILLTALGAVAFRPDKYVIGFLVYNFLTTAVLIAICFLKGEPPSWRWGK
jgi:hypothetical protein